VIIPNAISDDFIRNPGLPPAKKYNNRIISISNAWGELKNIDVLLFAFQKLRAEMKDAELLLVGALFTHESSKVLALKNGDPNLFDGVILCGQVNRSELAKLIDRSAILVHPSLTESFGNILLEAMARQIPCIGGKDSGAVPWVLNGGKAGLLCDVTSVDNLKNAMKRLLSNKILWAKYSQAGYSHLLENFTLDKVIKDTNSLYHLLLQGKCSDR
jgi:glycosyltransferase involved in cell wall biosynthesis